MTKFVDQINTYNYDSLRSTLYTLHSTLKSSTAKIITSYSRFDKSCFYSKRQYKFIFIILISQFSYLTYVKSQTNTWTGSTDNNWHKPCNWSLSLVPTCSHDVVIPTVTTYPVITGIAHSLSLSITSSANDALTINSSGGARLDIASSGGSCSGTATFVCCTFNNCGDFLCINHTIGTLAPETKTVQYGTVTSSLSGSSKCWITRNLGASTQASSESDGTDASAGWYWQFNLKQGYLANPTPVPTWTITSINENSDWVAAQDPCTIELGSGWRIPTYTEWLNADNNGGWTSWTDAYNSVLKLHAAGRFFNTGGTRNNRGTSGYCWSSSQYDNTQGYYIAFNSSFSAVQWTDKATGHPLRCIKD